MNFSKSPDAELLIVFNPLSGHFMQLPPLIHRRNPVLMHLIVDVVARFYQILVAGSSRPGDEAGSKLDKANELGVQVIDEAELMKMLR